MLVVGILLHYRQAKRMILANVLFSLLYTVSSLFLWFIINLWIPIAASEWGPITVKPAIINLPHPPPSLPNLTDTFNFPFILFWVILAINLSLIVRLQISKDSKKLMVKINVLLGLLYGVSSYVLWMSVNQWVDWNVASNWSPLLITPYRIPDLPTVEMPLSSLLNIPFVLFWIMFALNLYFLFRLQRSKETKPTT
jgi:hypothetical protein